MFRTIGEHVSPAITQELGYENKPFDIEAFLKEKNAERVVLSAEGKRDIVIYKIKHSTVLPYDLPQGYVFKGGIPRNLVMQECGFPVNQVRDVDIELIIDLLPPEQKTVAQKKYKAGVRKSESVTYIPTVFEYFDTRDFTINELFADNEHMYVSQEALEAIRDKKITPTEYEKNSWKSRDYDDYGIKPKLAMKALRLLVEFEDLYGHGEIEGIKDWQWDIETISIQYIILALDKSFEIGDKYGTFFYRKLLEKGVIDPKYWGQSGRELALSIQCDLSDTGSGFTTHSKALENLLEPEESEEWKEYQRYQGLADQLRIFERKEKQGKKRLFRKMKW